MSLATLDDTGSMARWVQVLVPARQLAEVIADTEFVPKAMKGKPDVVCAAIMYGDELGLGPMQALAGLDVVEGKPRPSAELCRALILRAGHTFAVHEMSGQRCRVSGLRAGAPETERVVVEWNHDMARAAGLTSKSNWRSYPRAMLLARATSDLARLLFPDVVKGLGYIAEDADNAAALETWGAPGEQPDAPPLSPRPAPQRRTRQRALPQPGYAIATPDRPGPDGSVDVPLVPGPREPEPEPAPDLPPEQPEPQSEPEAPPSPIPPGKLKALQTLLSAVMGHASPPEERHAVLAAITGHPVESSKHLTVPEGDYAIDVLNRIDNNTLTLVDLHDGTFAIEQPEPIDPWGTSDEPLS